MDDYQGKKEKSIEFSEKISAWGFILMVLFLLIYKLIY